jgi:hypothetical protein
MKKPNFTFSFETTPIIKLSEVEKILRREKIILPVPCRASLINNIEDGTFDGKLHHGYYLITVESFERWVKSLQIKKTA